MNDAVTCRMYRPNMNDIDEAKYAAFVAKTVKSNMRARDKADRRGDPGGLWYGFTDEQCAEAARSYCEMYRHQFARLVEIDLVTRQPKVAA